MGSPRVGEVGEIDTRAPFQSVKDAVNLFCEVSLSKEKSTSKPKPSESVLTRKETELLFARKELNKIKQQLESAKTTKDIALCELEKAKATFEFLTKKLTAAKESKASAIDEAAEAAKNQATQLGGATSQEAWSVDLERARKNHATTVTEIEAAKAELAKIRKDLDAALEAKTTALRAAEEAQRDAELKSEKAIELAKEIAALKEEQAKVMAEREELESVMKKLLCLKEEYDPEMTRNLEAKLAETTAEIDVLQEEMRKAHASEMDTVRCVTSELVEAIKTLEEVAEEESFLSNQVASLRTELEQVTKKQGKTVEVEVNEREQSLKIQQLAVETKEARREAEEMSRKAQELKREAEKAREVTKEAERKLELLKKEAEEAKAAEQRAIEEMKTLSESDPNANKIKLPAEMFESLSGKVKEYQAMVEKTEKVSMALVEAIRTRKEETDRKVEASMKAIEGIKQQTEVALKNAEMGESAKMALEAVVMRWREKEQKGET